MTAVADEDGAVRRAPGWWGSDSALLDDAEARRRLVAATVRCLVRRGSGRIRVEEVAVEAGVSRSTVYRYFRSRDDLILAVLLSRVDDAMAGVLRSLPKPEEASRSLCDVFLKCTNLISGDALSEALFAGGGRPVAESLPLTAEPVVEAVHRHLEPLLRRWRDDGQLRADLDLRETVRWLIAAGGILMSPPWSTWSLPRKRAFLETYVVRALVVPADPG
jgi:AcrR family transcriptional regulator